MFVVTCTTVHIVVVLIVVVSLLLLFVVVSGEIIGAVILPHGDTAYDPTVYDPIINKQSYNAAVDIHTASLQIGQWITNTLQPDIVFLSSPHSLVSLINNFGFFIGNTASGIVTIGPGDNVIPTNTSTHYYNVSLSSIQLHTTYTQQLVSVLSTQYQQNVSGITVIKPNNEESNIDTTTTKTTATTTTTTTSLSSLLSGIDMPLQWGEIIPLLFMQPNQTQCTDCCVSTNRSSSRESILQTTTTTTSRRRLSNNNEQQQQCNCSSCTSGTSSSVGIRKHIILAQPLRRYTMSVEMIPELLQLGKLIRYYLESIVETVTIVISGDLSHTHTNDGPYGYSNTSQLYDTAIGIWASNPCLNSQYLLNVAASYQPTALSCGFTGFILLHGILCNYDTTTNTNNTDEQQQQQQQQEWNSQVLVNRNATYFGMMVANFTKKTT